MWYKNVVYTPQIDVVKSQTPVPLNATVFGDKVFKEESKLNGLEWGPNPIWLLSTQEEEEFPGACARTEGQPWEGAGKKTAICMGTGEVSEGTNPISTSILDFLPPELWDNTFLMLKPLSLWCFVMVT